MRPKADYALYLRPYGFDNPTRTSALSRAQIIFGGFAFLVMSRAHGYVLSLEQKLESELRDLNLTLVAAQHPTKLSMLGASSFSMGGT